MSKDFEICSFYHFFKEIRRPTDRKVGCVTYAERKEENYKERNQKANG
jgi:hypothetical protein